MWKSCSWAGSVAGDGLLVGGRVLRNGSARGLRVDGLEDASMDMSGVRRQSQAWRKGRSRTRGTMLRHLPFLFWRVSIGRRRSPPSGTAEVSRGEQGDPWVRAQKTGFAFSVRELCRAA